MVYNIRALLLLEFNSKIKLGDRLINFRKILKIGRFIAGLNSFIISYSEDFIISKQVSITVMKYSILIQQFPSYITLDLECI